MRDRLLSLPWPHRCPECRRWTLGILEGITRIRFAVCADCAGLGDEPSESELERAADNVGVPFWERV